jgi:hypothetical protein
VAEEATEETVVDRRGRGVGSVMVVWYDRSIRRGLDC